MKKSTYEEFARFFESPSREGLRDLLKRNVGESDQLDFKEEWPSRSKIARHVLGFANSGGGCLVVGVDQNTDGSISNKGLQQVLDKADIQKSIEKYLPAQVDYQVMDFAFTESEYPSLVGKTYQVLIVEDKPRYLPFISNSNGEGIRTAAVYVRRGTATEEANYSELQSLVNRRLGTDYSTQSEFDLDRELAELKVLYRAIPSHLPIVPDDYEFEDVDFYRNPRYPDEDFTAFAARLIERKKNRISTLLGIERA